MAVDGKSGAKYDVGRCVHLLSALLHQARVTLAARGVSTKTNEITQLVPLLTDVTVPVAPGGQVVVTADALHIAK